MITTKAYITQTPAEGDNKFKVNIPLMSDNVSDEAIFDALLCSTSGNYNDYKVGDCVFVDFEDDKYNTAIIMGKLYTEVPEENEAYGLFNELKVTGNATLPANTMIGPYSAQDIFNLYQAVNNAKEGNWVDEESLFEYLKVWVKKDEFNTFFGDDYFNKDYPYAKNINFVNTIETGTDDAKKVWNNNYNPDYKTFVNDWKTFIQTRLNQILGLAITGNKPSITQIIAKMSASNSQTYTNTNITDISNPKAAVNATSYFPNYTNLVTHLRSFFSTDLPNIIKNIKTWVEGNFVKYNTSDTLKGKIIRVGSTSQIYGGTHDSSTLYFLTNIPGT